MTVTDEEVFLAPIQDIEENWEVDPGYVANTSIVFKNKILPTLYRKIDISNQEILFTDTMRVRPERVIDINKKLSILEKGVIIPQIMAVINSIRPIEFPYTPEKLTVYVESEGRYLGILYFRVPPRGIIPVRKFFYRDELNGWTEITYTKFRREIFEDVDSNTEQAENN